MIIKIRERLGSFAENKDEAAKIRNEHVIPLLDAGKKITFDFDGVTSITQSCVHALISEPIRKSSGDALGQMRFKNCSPSVRGIIEIVAEYSQYEVGS